MRTRAHLTALVGAFAVLVSMGRCAPDVSNIACAVSENCPDGLSCVAGRCVTSDGGASAGGAAGGSAGGRTGGGTAGGLVAGGAAGGLAGGTAGGASGGLAGGTAGGVVGGGPAGGAAGGIIGGGPAGGTAGGIIGGGPAGGTAGGIVGGGPAGGTAGGIVGGGPAGGAAGCVRDQDCGAITGCAAPRCQGNGQCSTVPVDGGVICRAAAGLCDVEERCSGTSTACPANLLRTTVCGPAAFPCEADAVCDGVNPFCPLKPFRDGGSVCAAPACLPLVTCSGVATACVGPPDAGQRCDDNNLCSVDICANGTSCTWAVEPSITSRALLNSFADGGVIRLVVPPSTSTISIPLLGDLTISLCPAGPRFMTSPPECMLELRTTGMTFTTTRTTQFTGDGPVSMRVQLIPLTLSGAFSGAGGVSMGLESCVGAMPPPMVAPSSIGVTYGFGIDEGDGGQLTLLPFRNIESDVRGQVRACLPSSVSPMIAPLIADSVRNNVASIIRQTVDQAFTASLMEQLCLRPSDAGVCQYGTPSNGRCVAGMNCFSARHFRNVVPTIPACLR